MGKLADAVTHGINNDFINWAEGFGKQIKQDGVTTSQIRNIFGSIKKMEMNPEMDLPGLLLLKPRIAYATYRHKQLRNLTQELRTAIDAVDAAQEASEQESCFMRFCQGFEAILAYHRAAGGK